MWRRLAVLMVSSSRSKTRASPVLFGRVIIFCGLFFWNRVRSDYVQRALIAASCAVGCRHIGARRQIGTLSVCYMNIVRHMKKKKKNNAMLCGRLCMFSLLGMFLYFSHVGKRIEVETVERNMRR